MSNKSLHYTLTPVQAFVSQARRTRDLWAGSYLLSYLVGKAMKDNDPEQIIFPDTRNDALIRCISGKASKDEAHLASRLGSVPNRFTAKLITQTGDDYKDRIENNWVDIANAVKDYLQHRGLTFDQRLETLWNKQITGLWEHQWVVGEESYLLDQRKNLRNHYNASEEGEKCTICGEREELSPYQAPSPTLMNEWWEETIRPKIHPLDLGQNERLCAVCLTKRLFPKVAKKAIGWNVPEFYPSTAYLSVIDWLITILKNAKEDRKLDSAITEFTNVASDVLHLPMEKAERYTFIQGIHSLLNELNNPAYKTFTDLDGDVFYLSSIQQESYELKGKDKQEIKANRNKLIKSLKDLYNAAGSKPSPFYAILFMDGDGMGALLGNKTADEKLQISEALGNFTQKVPDIVKQHNGILTYAGGDDVFALMPVSTAMQCAMECRKAYQKAFVPIENIVRTEDATISAAIEYTHMNTALGIVVRDSHRLLDDIAKNKTGRDAIACRVWKRGGPILTWSQPWQLESHPMTTLELFQQVFADFHGNKPEKFSSKLIYKLRDLFELVQAGDDSPFTYNNIKGLLVSEYLANREYDSNLYKNLSSQEKRAEAESLIDKLLQLCRHHERSVDASGSHINELDKYTADAALLIRFLSQKEV